MSDHKGWPADETPVAEAVEVTATLRNDEPVMQLDLFDWTKDSRRIQLTEAAAYEVLRGAAAFLEQLHKARRAELGRGAADPRKLT